ncbi:MAG TPA: alanine racemase [bacterium]|nr:alanine racemase [bacterium]
MSAAIAPTLGIETLETPSLVVDLDRLEGNIARWAAYAKDAGVKLRPHGKTHKCVEIARRQLEAGAVGLTLAKIGEAEVMARAGVEDVFLAYEVVGGPKLPRLLDLARKIRIRVGVDSMDVATPLADAAASAGVRVDVMLEVDTGLGRCGVAPGAPLLALARAVAGSRGLRLAGIFTYRGYRAGRVVEPPGDPLGGRPRGDAAELDGSDLETAGREEGEIMVREAARLRAAGLAIDDVSVGSTPTGRPAARVPGVTEVRPGTYVFNDAMQVRWGSAKPEECALAVVCRVISRPSRDVAVLDAGSKVLTAERGPFSSRGDSHGVLRGYPDCQIDRLWEEHGRVQLTEDARRLRVGDFVEVIPAHVCPTVNLARRLVCVRDGRVEATWEVAARAEVQ